MENRYIYEGKNPLDVWGLSLLLDVDISLGYWAIPATAQGERHWSN